MKKLLAVLIVCMLIAPAAMAEQVTIENGAAQPVFKLDDIVREVVYVETPNDTDGDGQNDLVQVLVQHPDAENIAVIYEARPYSAGVTGAYDMDAYNAHIVNADLDGASPAVSEVALSVGETGEAMTPAEDIWEYTENVHAYDYFLIRGYAYVSCSGLGTMGSEGIETCGGEVETAAFCAVIDWLNGRADAYTDRTRAEKVTADWCSGNVAMTGRSYGGTTAVAAAATGIDGLRTIIPVAAISSWYDYYRSQGTPAGGLYYPGDDCDILAAYCMSRLNEASEDSELAVTYTAYLTEMINAEDRATGDYNDFWAERDYAANGDFKCSALIVHGLNDFNVRTKQFDMLYNAMTADGCEVRMILHQGAHYSPDKLEGLNYYDILDRWLAHYLYGEENGAEGEAAVLVQSNVDLTWSEYDAWTTSAEPVVLQAGEGEATFTSDLAETGFDTSAADQDEMWIEYCSDMDYAWEAAVISGETNASVAYSFDVESDMHISGTPVVTVTAAADRSSGILSAMLVDVADDAFTVPMLAAYSEGVDDEVVAAGAIAQGGELEPLDMVNFVMTETNAKIITRGWMDIRNRTSVSDADETVAGEYYTYTISLQPEDYTVAAGHKLVLVLYSVDPEVTYWPAAVTSYTVDNTATSVEIPVR